MVFFHKVRAFMTTSTSRREFLRSSPQLVAGLSLAASLATRESAATAQSPAPSATVQRSAAPGRSPIKIGQIGVRHAHASKLSVYRASQDYEVVGIVEPDADAWDRAQSQAAFRDLPRMTEEQLLTVPGLQAVLVETHVRDLLASAQRCADAGMHIHLDKPAGQSLVDYQRLLDTARRKNLMVQMGYMYRYNPAVLLLRDFLKRGFLGDVFQVHAVIGKVVGAKERLALAEFSGGIMFELGCHMIDLVVGVIGPPTKVTPYFQRVSPQADELNDNMLAVFEAAKALASVESTAVEIEGGARRQLVVCGTRGTFQIQPIENPVATISLAAPSGGFRKGVQTRDLSKPKFTRYVADAADMARIIRGEKGPDFAYDHDLAVQRSVLEACGMAVN